MRNKVCGNSHTTITGNTIWHFRQWLTMKIHVFDVNMTTEERGMLKRGQVHIYLTLVQKQMAH